MLQLEPHPLDDRQRQVLRLLADGSSVTEVARTLCWSERTIKVVVHDVVERLGARNRTHAVVLAVRAGLV